MARAELSVTINHLRTVVKAMRELGVASWAGSPMGDLILGQEPPPRDQATTSAPDENAERRRYYQDVLNRRVTDEELKKLP
jgi:hypothetical protein